MDDDWFQAYGHLLIVLGSVQMVSSGKCVCWGHFGSWGNLPLQIKVLDEEEPSGLLSGQLLRIFDIEEIFVVSDDGDKMCGSLEILAPFFQS